VGNKTINIVSKVKTEITAEQIAGILCTAFESGYTPWVKVESMVEPKRKVILGNSWNEYTLYSYPVTGGAAILSDTYGNSRKRYRLDLKAIRKGLQIMANKYPRHFADFVSENEDGITGAVFLQCCVFGDVIYD
jgi:hypothetical protein